jgi:hypothetical protein
MSSTVEELAERLCVAANDIGTILNSHAERTVRSLWRAIPGRRQVRQYRFVVAYNESAHAMDRRVRDWRFNSLSIPTLADQVRATFATDLATRSARIAILARAADLLSYPDAAGPLLELACREARRAAEALSR